MRAAILRARVLAQNGGDQAVQVRLVGGTAGGGLRGRGRVRVGQHERDAGGVTDLADRVELLAQGLDVLGGQVSGRVDGLLLDRGHFFTPK